MQDRHKPRRADKENSKHLTHSKPGPASCLPKQPLRQRTFETVEPPLPTQPAHTKKHKRHKTSTGQAAIHHNKSQQRRRNSFQKDRSVSTGKGARPHQRSREHSFQICSKETRRRRTDNHNRSKLSTTLNLLSTESKSKQKPKRRRASLKNPAQTTSEWQVDERAALPLRNLINIYPSSPDITQSQITFFSRELEERRENPPPRGEQDIFLEIKDLSNGPRGGRLDKAAALIQRAWRRRRQAAFIYQYNIALQNALNLAEDRFLQSRLINSLGRNNAQNFDTQQSGTRLSHDASWSQSRGELGEQAAEEQTEFVRVLLSKQGILSQKVTIQQIEQNMAFTHENQAPPRVDYALDPQDQILPYVEPQFFTKSIQLTQSSFQNLTLIAEQVQNQLLDEATNELVQGMAKLFMQALKPEGRSLSALVQVPNLQSPVVVMPQGFKNEPDSIAELLFQLLDHCFSCPQNIDQVKSRMQAYSEQIVPLSVFASYQRKLQEMDNECADGQSPQQRKARQSSSTLRAYFDKACFDGLNEQARIQLLCARRSELVKMKQVLQQSVDRLLALSECSGLLHLFEGKRYEQRLETVVRRELREFNLQLQSMWMSNLPQQEQIQITIESQLLDMLLEELLLDLG